jgi:hypothetical protein
MSVGLKQISEKSRSVEFAKAPCEDDISSPGDWQSRFIRRYSFRSETETA